MHLALILAILAVVSISEYSEAAATPPFWACCLGVLTVALALSMTAHQAGSLIAKGVRDCQSRSDWRRWMRRAKLLERGGVLCWLVSMPLATALFAWPHAIRQSLPPNAVIVDEVLILAPTIFALLGVWWGICQVDLAVQDKLPLESHSPAPVGRWNRSRELPNPQRHKCALGDETASTPWRKLGDYARHHLGLVLPPVLVVFALEDTSPWWGIGQMRWAVYMAALFALAAVCPLLVRFLWRTHPLPDGPLRHRLTAAAAQIGVPVRRLLVWETGGAMVNAAVAGLTPHLRYVLLSDGLLDKFDDDAIESVFRHEAAHVRRRHLLWRLLLVTFPVWVVAAAIVLAPPAWSTELPTTALIVIPLVVAIYCGGALCWFSRLLEHDADLEACRDGANAISNRRLQSYLQMIDQLGAIAGDRRTWLHPSLTARRSLLIDAATPARFQQYRRRANVAIATVLFSYLGAMAMFAYALTV